MTYKFRTGETVTIAVRRYERTPGGSFSVVRTLPAEQGIRQYRIRSNTDGHERVVSEAELA